jgi:hemolysin activation/secretion protein
MVEACMQKILYPVLFLLLMAGASAQSLPAAPGAILTPPQPANAPPPPVAEKLALPPTSHSAVLVRVFSIRGGRALPSREIGRIFAPLAGHRLSTAQLNGALDAVDRFYADAGFALGRAYIPAQKIEHGVLTVQILEGYVGAVVVRTRSARVKNTLARYADAILASRPLRSAVLARQLRLMAEIPGVRLTARLTRMNLQTGAAALVLDVQYRSVTASMALDSRGDVRGLPLQPYLTLQANDLLGAGDQFSLTSLLSPVPKDAYFLQLGASTLIGNDGWRAGANGFLAKARADGVPPGIDLSSVQMRGELQVSDPFIRAEDRQLTLTGGSYFSGTIYDLNHLRIAQDRYLAAYAQLTDVRTFSPQIQASLDLRATSGFAFSTALPHSRANSTRDFARLGLGAAVSYAPTAHFSILLRADGQLASGSLMAGEEAVYGGERFGRGYQSGMLSGDEGLGLSLQPQYRFALIPDWDAAAYLFSDYAHVANTKGDGQGNATLASAGIGFTVTHDGYIAGLGIAEPLKRVPGYAYRLTPRLFGTLQARL